MYFEPNSVFSGLAWKFGERVCAQLVSIMVSTVLARILMPEAFGVVAMVNIFIIIANVFVSENIGSALVQKKDADQLDFDTIFYISITFSVVLYIILFLSSPLIARFYGEMELVWIVRIFALKLPVAAISTVQHAYVSRHMLFRKFFFSTLIGTVLSGIVGIVFAMIGMGVWALIFQYLTNSIVDCIVLFISVPWKPKLEFSLDRARSLFSYGWKVLMTGMVSTLYGQLRGMIIGKIYTAEDLAYYNTGERFPALIGNNIDITVGSVLFPAISNVSDDIQKVKNMTQKAMRMSAYIVFPFMTGLAVVSRPLITCLLTERWLPSLFFLRIFCLEKGVSPFCTSNIQAIKALGRSDVLLKMEILKKGIGIIVLLWALQFGLSGIGYSCVFVAILALIINMVPNGQLLGYSFGEQIKDVAPILFLNAGMAGILLVLMHIGELIGANDFIILLVTFFAGVIVYVLMSKIFRIKELEYLFNILKGMQKRDHEN